MVANVSRDTNGNCELLGFNGTPKESGRARADTDCTNSRWVRPFLGAHVRQDVCQVPCPTTVTPVVRIAASLSPGMEVERDNPQSVLGSALAELPRKRR